MIARVYVDMKQHLQVSWIDFYLKKGYYGKSFFFSLRVKKQAHNLEEWCTALPKHDIDCILSKKNGVNT